MAVITAAMVGQLRAKTDAPMMECKKALTEANGDMQKAEDILRVKLGNKASKASSRIAAEGVIAIHVDGNTAAADSPTRRKNSSYSKISPRMQDIRGFLFYMRTPFA